MKRLEKPVGASLFFLLMLLVFILMNRRETLAVTVPTSTLSATFTSVSTIIPTLVLPTMTSVPPVVIIITQEPVLVHDDGVFNSAFFTATVCNNVPVFSQPASNFNLIIGELYKGNSIDVTGQSQFWSRVSYQMGQVGYIPTDYIEC